MEQNTEKLEGLVEYITFHNEENGFTVMEVSVSDEMVCVVGEIIGITEGEAIIATGRFTAHKTYGMQFKAELIERALPAGEHAILKYLSSGVIHGIGPALAKRIVAAFGDKTLEVLERNPERLTVVKGISEEKAKKFGMEFERINGLRSALAYYAGIGIDSTTAILIWKTWGSRGKEMIEENPYVLCTEDIGIPFDVVDKIADRFDIDGEAMERLEACLCYVLRHNTENGHTCLPKGQLLNLTNGYLGVSSEAVSDALEELREKDMVVEYRGKDQTYCYLPNLYHAEEYIANRVIMAMMAKNYDVPTEKELDQLEEATGLQYDPIQREAIREAVSSPFFIMTGGPGTGKTTTLLAILTYLQSKNEKVALAAPTGRAAKRMSEVTNHEASTIHRMLEVEPHSHPIRFKRKEDNPLPYTTIIVDEMSMVDTELMANLLLGMRLSTRLIMVGDSDQLPSVSPGNVLSDLMGSGAIPTVTLNHVFRQAAESCIVTNAHLIQEGNLPVLDRKDNDFFFLKREDRMNRQSLIVELVSRRLPQSYQIDPLTDIQVITPGKQGPVGTRELNRLLQEKLNPKDILRSECQILGRTFREGDKVMQIRNNYDIEWKTALGIQGAGVFNGDMGQIGMIDNGSKTIMVQFEDRKAYYTFEDADQLEHAYAVTVHKSQGSEFDCVVLAVDGNHPNLNFRNLLYTAVTRAKKLLIITGTPETIREMVNNNKRSLRYTNLKPMILEAGEMLT